MKLPPAMNSKPFPPSAIRDCQSEISAAFTRAELLITLAVFSLLVAIVLPALAHDRARSARIICANNLRQIGAAMQTWGNDHQDLQPWEVPPVEGGTKAHPLAVNVWLHFAVLSNELASARILFCPTDTGTPAFDFGSSPEGGYLSPNYRNAATSYLVAHRDSNEPMVMTVADRNLLGAAPRSCVVFGMALSIRVPSSGQPTARWGGVFIMEWATHYGPMGKWTKLQIVNCWMSLTIPAVIISPSTSSPAEQVATY